MSAPADKPSGGNAAMPSRIEVDAARQKAGAFHALCHTLCLEGMGGGSAELVGAAEVQQ
jgi:hypothetical protein